MAVQEFAGWASFDDGVKLLGLEAEFLRTAVGDGNRARVKVLGPHHAPSAQGYCAWDGILASLSATLDDVPHWERLNPQSLPVLLNKDKKVLLFVTSGDEYTGLTGNGKLPRSRRSKGGLVQALGRQNKKRFDGRIPLFDVPESDEDKLIAELKGYLSYVLLVHFSKRDLQARYEVALLDETDAGNYIQVVPSGRIIAEPYRLTVEEFDSDDPNDFDDPGDYPVPPKS